MSKRINDESEVNLVCSVSELEYLLLEIVGFPVLIMRPVEYPDAVDWEKAHLVQNTLVSIPDLWERIADRMEGKLWVKKVHCQGQN